jgi:phosphoribosylformimino-5-aminoimidazole carboxamide ribotide isomerase
MEDIKNLLPLKEKGLKGAITGRAIYEGTLNFSEAVSWIKSRR